MHGLPSHDGDNIIDWGKTSSDYAAHRPGPPASFYERLRQLGVGLPGQKILDLATGTGALAWQFANQGASVIGIDISEKQVKAARELGPEGSSSPEFLVAAAEELPVPDASADVATANQCWLYFDREKVISELRRVLRPGGCLVTSHFSWLPRLDDVACQTELLVLEFNPKWSAADWSGDIPAHPRWSEGIFNVRAMFQYDEPIEFTRESWRGRIRACRGIGASLSRNIVDEFDAAHEKLLKKIAPESFMVLHRIDAHIFEFKANQG